MRTLAFATLAVLAAPLFGACGGVDGSDLFNPPPNGNNDGGPNGDGSNGQDGGGNCDPAKCAINVPAGFRLVTFAADRNKSCPSGWTTGDVVQNPMADPAACSCSCNVTTPPDCSMGTIDRYNDYSSAATCGTPATTLMATGGCDLTNIQLQGFHYSATPPPPQGGACSFDAKADTSKVTATPARVCQPPASCTGSVCGASNVCVAQDGDVACPGAYPTKTLVGATPNVDCSACAACTVSAECTGTLSLFTDSGCGTGKLDFPVDGTCNTYTSTGGYIYSFKYAGSLKGSPSCGGTVPTSTPTPKLDKPTTVCCKKPG